MSGSMKRRLCSPGQPGKKARPYIQNNQSKCVAQVGREVESPVPKQNKTKQNKTKSSNPLKSCPNITE
jgi:hypothetical protein